MQKNRKTNAPRHAPPEDWLHTAVDTIIDYAKQELGAASTLDIIFEKQFLDPLIRWGSGTGKDGNPDFPIKFTKQLIGLFEGDVQAAGAAGCEQDFSNLFRLIRAGCRACFPNESQEGREKRGEEERNKILQGLKQYLTARIQDKAEAKPRSINQRLASLPSKRSDASAAALEPAREAAWDLTTLQAHEGGAPPAQNWIERLNNLYPNEVRIRRVLDEQPEIVLLAPLALSSEAAQIAEKFRKNPKNLEASAVYVSTVWDDNPVVLRARPTDYAAVCALNEMQQRPTMLSGNALLYCLETEELILHRRSKELSRDFPECLHTFGGGYIPPGSHIHHDNLSLVRTAQRETNQECGIAFEISRLPKLLLGEELKIGFVHLALLGVGVSQSALDTAIRLKLANKEEGEINRLKAADLPQKLHDPDWVPAGKVQVLAWLALGARIGTQSVRFGGASGPDIFNGFFGGCPSQ